MKFSEKFHFIKLEVLSPVHIGNGESLDPFSYVMAEDKENNKPYLHYIDLPAFVENHRNLEELIRKFQGEFHSVRSFIAQSPEILRHTKSKSEILSKSIFDEYNRKLKDPRNLLKVAPAIKNSDNNAMLIPGSSIKGAIRTAIIDYLDRKYKIDLKGIVRSDDHKGSGYTGTLETVFGKIGDSVFKNLKIGDFEALPDSGCFVEAKELGKKPDRKTSTPKDPCEMLPGACMGRTTTIYGKISLGCFTAAAPQEVSFTVKSGKIYENWTLPQLMDLCTDFYQSRFAKELTDFYEKPHLSKAKQSVKKIEPLLPVAGAGEMLLRVGHYSHIECMSITNNLPKCKIVGGRTVYGSTRTLADGIHPFGWIKLSICNEAEYRQWMKSRDEANITTEIAVISSPVQKPVVAEKEKVIWASAILTWNPGSATLVAIFEGKKAELKLSAEKSIVPESMHNKLFKKKDAVKASVTIEKDGNSLKILKIDL